MKITCVVGTRKHKPSGYFRVRDMILRGSPEATQESRRFTHANFKE